MSQAAPILWAEEHGSASRPEGHKVTILDFRFLEGLGLTQNEVQRLQIERDREIQERSTVLARAYYSIPEHQPTARLNNGYLIPLCGLGTW